MKKFEARRWKRTEKSSVYYADKILLGNQLGIPEPDMIDYLIDGIENIALQNQECMFEFEHLTDLLRIMSKLVVRDNRPEHAYIPNTKKHNTSS